MAVVNPIRPLFVQNRAQLYPSQYYSRPALAPMPVLGHAGTQKALMDQYQYTIRQMATSPFVVNNTPYMERIRARYNINDRETYDLMGGVGGFIGAGLGAAFGAGFLRVKSPFSFGLTSNPFNRNFYRASNFNLRNPIEIGSFNPRRQSQHDFFFNRGISQKAWDASADSRKLYAQANTQLNNLRNTTTDLTQKLSQATEDLNKAKEQWNAVKYKTRSVDKATREAAKQAQEVAEANLDTLNKAVIANSEDIQKASGQLSDAVQDLTKKGIIDETFEVGTDITKKSSGMAPWVGLGLDLYSLGVSSSALSQSLNAGDTQGIILNSIAVLGDALAVAGDVLEFTPWAPAGVVLSIAGAVISIGSSILTGYLAGQTIGRSLSPSGMKAQEMYAKNLYSSTVQRPVTTIGSLMVMFGLPMVLGAAARADRGSIVSRLGVRTVADWMTNTTTGAFGRSMLSMMTLQGAAGVTSLLDNQLPWAPEDPDDVNFVSAISLYGDINDNLFGATRTKSVILGAISEEPNTMREAYLRSWGMTDDMYKSVQADDIREALGWELGPLGNSVFSTLGEIFLDPQNIYEVVQTTARKQTVKHTRETLEKVFKQVDAKIRLQGKDVETVGIEKLVDEFGLFSPNARGEFDHNMIERIAETYLSSGGNKQTFVENMTKLFTQRTKGFGVRVTKQQQGLAEQIEIAYNLFRDLYSGTQIRGVISQQEKMKASYRKYLEITNKTPEQLTANDHIILEDAKTAIVRLKKYYEDQGFSFSDTEIITRFIDDYNIQVTPEALRHRYVVDQNIRWHIDNADVLASAVNRIANPTQMLARGLITRGQAIAAWSRTNNVSKKRQKQIDDWDNLIKESNQKNLKTTEDLKRAEEELNQRRISLTDALTKISEVDEEKSFEIKEKVKDEMDKINKDFLDESEKLKKSIELLEKTEKETNDMIEKFVYFPQVYEFSRGEKITVTKESVKGINESIKTFEEQQNINDKNRSARLREIQKFGTALEKGAAQDYKNQRFALQEYHYMTAGYKVLNKTAASIKNNLLRLNSVSLAVQEELIKVVTLFSYFRTYYNDTVIRKDSVIYQQLLSGSITKQKNMNNRKTELSKAVAEAKAKVIESRKVLNTVTKDKNATPEQITRAQKDLEASEKLHVKAKEEQGKNTAALKSIRKTIQTYQKNLNDIKKGVVPDGERSMAVMNQSKFYKAFENSLKDPTDETHKLLLRYGIIPEFGGATISGTQKINVKDAPLQLKLIENNSIKLTRTILRSLGIQDVGTLLSGSLKLPNDMTKEIWNNLSTLEKYDYTIMWLNRLDINNISDVYKLTESQNLKKVVKSIGDMLNEKSTVRYIQLGHGVSDETLRAIVFSRIWNGDSGTDKAVKAQINHVLTEMKDFKNGLEKQRKGIEDKINNSKQKDGITLDQLDASVLYLTELANRSFKQSFVYSFLDASQRSGINAPRRETSLVFSDVQQPYNWLSEEITKEMIKESKTNKHTFTEQEVLNRIVTARSTIASREKLAESVERVKAIRQGTLTEEQLEAQTANEIARQQNETRKAQSKEQVGTIKENVDFALQNLTGTKETDVFGYFNTNNLAAKSPNVSAKDLKMYLTGSEADIDDRTHTFTIRQRTAYIERGNKKPIRKSYTQLLDEFNRTSEGHREMLFESMEVLWDLYKAGSITFDFKQLVDVKAVAWKSEKQLFIERLALTYLEKGSFDVSIKNTSLYYYRLEQGKAIDQAIFNWIYANRKNQAVFDDTSFDGAGNITTAALDKFKEFLTSDTSDYADSVRVKIRAMTAELLKEKMHRGNLIVNGQVHRSIIELTEKLYDYESTDIEAFSPVKVSVANDVPHKLLFGDPRFKDFTDDLLNFNQENFTDVSKTDMFWWASKMMDTITEEYTQKKYINFKNITNISKNKSGEFIFTFTNKDKTVYNVSLFELMMHYKLPMITLNSLIHRAGNILGRQTNITQNVLKTQTEMRTQVMLLADTYGRLLSHNYLNINEDVMADAIRTALQNGDTPVTEAEIEDTIKKELDLLKDAAIATLYYNNSYDRGSTTKAQYDPDREIDLPFETLSKIMNGRFADLIRKALDNKNKNLQQKIFQDIPNAEQLSDLQYMAIYILYGNTNPRISKEDKELFFDKVFFFDGKVSLGRSNDDFIRGLNTEIKTTREQLSRATTETSKRRLESKIKNIEDQKAHYQKVQKNVQYSNLYNNKTELRNFLMNPDNKHILLNAIQNRRDLDSNQYVQVTKPDGTIVLALRSDVERNGSNVTKVSRGLPNYNNAIIFDVLRNQDKNASALLEKAMVNDDLWKSLIDPKSFKVIRSNDNDVLVVVKDNVARAKIMDQPELYKESLKITSYHQQMYFVLENELNEIIKMDKENQKDPVKNKIDVAYTYITKETVNANISGYVENIINFKTSSYLFDSYISNIQDIRRVASEENLTVDEVVEKVLNYHRAVKNYVYVSKMYAGNVSLGQTQSFKKLQDEAKLIKAVQLFMDHINVDNKGTFEFVNVITLLKNFFREDGYIKPMADGNYKTSEQILRDIQSVELKAQLEKVVEGKKLKDIIYNALVEVRKVYGASDLNFNNITKRILTSEFFNTIKEIRSIVTKTLQNQAREEAKAVRVFRNINAPSKRGRMTWTPLESFKENYEITSRLTPRVTSVTLNPYGQSHTKALTRTLNGYKAFLKQQNEHGESVESILIARGTALSKETQKRVNDYNKRSRKNKSDNINFSNTHMFIKASKKFLKQDPTKDYETFALPIDKQLSVKTKETLEKTARNLYENILYPEGTLEAMIKEYREIMIKNGTILNDPNRVDEHAQAAIEYDHAEPIHKSLVEINSFRIQHPKAFESVETIKDFLTYIVVSLYSNNIARKIAPSDQLTLLSKSLAQVKQEYLKGGMSEKEFSEKLKTESFSTELISKMTKISDELLKEEKKRVFIPEDKDYEIFRPVKGHSNTIQEIPYWFALTFTDFNQSNIQAELNALDTAAEDIINVVRNAMYSKEYLENNEPINTALPGMTYNSIQEFMNSLTPDEQVFAKMLQRSRIGESTEVTKEEFDTLTRVIKEADERGTETLFSGEVLRAKEIISQIRERRKVEGLKFAGAQDVFRHVGWHVLDNDVEFMQELRNFLTGKSYINEQGDRVELTNNKISEKSFFAQFGLNEQSAIAKLYNYNTWFSTTSSLIDDLSTENAFALTILVNTFKKNYLTYRQKMVDNVKNPEGKWSLKSVHEYYVKNALQRKAHDFQLEQRLKNSSTAQVYGNDQVHNIYEDTNYLFGAQSYVSSMNKKLKSIIFTDTRQDTTRTLESQSIIFTESDLVSLSRNIQHKIYNSIYKKDEKTWRLINTNLLYRYAQGDVVVDFVAERQAKSLDSVGSAGTRWQTLRIIFTDVLKIIKTDFKEDEFVRMAEIGILLGNLISNRDSVKFYSEQYDNFIKTSKLSAQEITESNEKVQAIVDYFNADDALIDMKDDHLVKAIMGSLLGSKFNLIWKDDKDLNQRFSTYTSELVKAEPILKQKEYLKISRALSNISSVKDVAKIVYGKPYSKLTKEQKAKLDRVQELNDFIKSSQALFTYDTMDYVNNDSAQIATNADIRLQETKNKRKRNSSIRGGKTNSFNSLVTKYIGRNAVVVEDEVADMISEAEAELAKIYNDIAINKAKNAEYILKDNEALDLLYDEIIENHPGLLMKYAQEQAEQYETLEAEVQKSIEAVAKIKSESKTLYTAYENAISAKIQHRSKHKALQSLLDIVRIKVSNGYGYSVENFNMFKEEAQKLGYNTFEEFKADGDAYLKQLETLAKAEEKARYAKYTNSKGKEVSLNSALVHIRRLNTALENAQEKLNNFLIYNPENIEDAPNSVAKKRQIVKEFLDELKISYTTSNQKDYKAALKGKIPSVLTAGQKKKVHNVYKKKLAVAEKRSQQALDKAFSKLKGFMYSKSDPLGSINKLINSLDSSLDENKSSLKTLKNIKRAYEKNQSIIKHYKSVIDTLTTTQKSSVQEILTNVAKKYVQEKNVTLSDKDISDFVEHIQKNMQPESWNERKTLYGARQALEKKLSAVRKKIADLENIISLPLEIEDLQKEYDELTHRMKREEAKASEASLERQRDASLTNSNIGLYRKLYGENDNTLYSADDESIIVDVINKSAPHFKGGAEALRKLINEHGEFSIHNDVVDALITRLNYIQQLENRGEQLPHTYHVVDIETLPTDYGKVPYSLTIVRSVGGEIDIKTIRLNNQVFLEDKETSKDLQRFYEQQYRMALRNENRVLSDAEKDLIRIRSDQATDKLITQIKTKKTTVGDIETLVYLLKLDSNIPIIAHNGAEFDFPHIENMLQTISKRYLVNLYYEEMQNKDPKKIIKDFKENIYGRLSEDETNTLVDILNENKDLLLGEMLEGKYVIKDTVKRQEALNEFIQASWAVKATNAILKAEADLGYVVNDDLRESLITGTNSRLQQSKKILIDFLLNKTSKEETLNILFRQFVEGATLQHYDKDTKQKLRDEIIAKLDAARKTFDDLSNDPDSVLQFKTRHVTPRDHILGGYETELGIKKANDGVPVGQALQTLLDHLDEVEKNILFVENSTADNIATFLSDTEVTKQEIGNQIEDIKKQLSKVDTDMTDIQKSISDIYSTLRTMSNEINKVFSRPTYKALRHIKNNYENYIKRSKRQTRAVLDSNILNIEIEELRNELQKTTNTLLTLVNALERYQSSAKTNEDKKTLEDLLNKSIPVSVKDIFSLTKVSDKAELLVKLKEKQTILENYLNRFTLGIKDSVDVEEGQALEEYGVLFKRTLKRMQKQKETAEKNIIDLLDKEAILKLLGKDTDALKELLQKDPDLFIEEVTTKLDKHKDSDIEYIKDANTGLVQLVKNLNVILNKYNETQDPTTLKRVSAFMTLFKNEINKELSDTIFAIDLLNRIEPKEGGNLGSVSAIEAIFNEQLVKLKQIEDTQEEARNVGLFGVLSGGLIPSYEMTAEEQAKVASTQMNREYALAVGSGVERIYDTALKGDDKYMVTFNPDNYYLVPEHSGVMKIGTYDLQHDVMQELIFSTTAPNRVTLKLTYSYTERGKELLGERTVVKTIKNHKDNYEDGEQHTEYIDLREQIDAMFDPKDITRRVRGSLTRDDIVLYNNKDTAESSIYKLLELYEKYQYSLFGKSSSEAEIKKGLEALTKDTYSVDSLPLNSLIAVNASVQLKEKLMQYLSTIRYAQKQGQFKDIARIYTGLYNKILSKYVALDPGKVLNTIPRDFAPNASIKFDQKSLNDFANKTGIILEKSSEGSAGSTFSLRSFYDVVPPFRQSTNTIRTVLSYSKMFGTFTTIGINNRYFKADNEKSISVQDFIKGLNHPDDKLVRELLETSENAFVPNVLTKEQKDHYDKDILHKIGVNLTVAFINKVSAFEDTILVDEDDALALGWDEGNKTWLGIYGFKGAVRYEKGLRAKYGATFVAERSSIMNRGSYGVVIDQAINNIRDYFAGIDRGAHFNLIKAHIKKHEKTLKKIFSFDKTTKQIIVDPNVDYKSVLEQIETGLTSKLTQAIYKESEDIQKIGHLGSIYVLMDPEHIAEHMKNETEITEDGDVKVFLRDYKGSVKSGVVLSPSVLYSIISKGVKNWEEAFDFDYEPLRKLTEVMFKGYRALMPQDTSGKDIISTSEEIKKEEESNGIFKIFLPEILEYRNWESILSDPNSDKTTKDKAELKLGKLNEAIRNKAQDLYGGRNGTFYNTYYKRHPGIRQQLLANVDLKAGELKVSLDGFMALVEQRQGFLRDSQGNEIDAKEIKRLLDKYKKVEASDKTTRQKSEEMREYMESDTVFNNVFGNAIIARSPVQDYNAVPMMKIVGFTNHYATEANAYLYGMIGGDNDGDTIGIVGLTKKGAEIFAPDDATKTPADGIDNYYDVEYYNKIEKKLTVEKNEEWEDLTNIDLRYAVTGKKAFPTRANEDKRIRDHFTWDELYLNAYGEDVLDYIKTIDVPGDIQLTNDEKFAYANVIIRYLNGGSDYFKDEDTDPLHFIKNNSDYTIANVNKFIKEYNFAHDNIIYKRYLFDKLVSEGDTQKFDETRFLQDSDIETYRHNLDKYSQEQLSFSFIKDYEKTNKDLLRHLNFEKIYAALMMNTISRVRTSKLGINIFGGNRKQEMVAAFLSNLSEINKDPQGQVWIDNNLVDSDGNITILSVKEGLLGKTPFDYTLYKDKVDAQNKLYAEIKKKKPNMQLSEKSIKDLIEIIYDNHLAQDKTNAVLTSVFGALQKNDINELADAISNIKDVTGLAEHQAYLHKNFADHLKNESAKAKAKNEAYKLTEQDKIYIGIILFGRFAKSNLKLINKAQYKNVKEDIENISSMYVRQHIIGRKQLNNLSQDASEIIAVAKHFGFDIDSAEYLNRFEERVGKQTKDRGIKRVAIMPWDHTLSVAIAMDMDMFKDDYTLRYRDAHIKEQKAEATTPVQIKNTYNNVGSMLTDFKNIHKGQIGIELFGDATMPDAIYNQVVNSIERIFEIFNKSTNSWDDSIREIMTDPTAPLDTLMRFGIKQYSVLRSILSGYKLFETMNNILYATVGENASIKDYSYLKNANGFLEFSIYLWNKVEQRSLELSEISGEHNEFVTWMLNTLADEQQLFTFDSATGQYTKDVLSNVFTGNKSVNKLATYELADRLAGMNDMGELIGLDEVKPTSQSLLKDILTEKLNELELERLQEVKTIQDILNDIRQQQTLLRASYNYKAEQKEAQAKAETPTTTSEQVKFASAKVFNYHNIARNITDIQGQQNKYEDLRKERSLLAAKSRKLHIILESKQQLLEHILRQRKFAGSLKDKEGLIARLEMDKQDILKRIENLKNIKMNYIYDEHFSDFTRYLTVEGKSIFDVTKRNQEPPMKPFTNEDARRIANRGLLNMERRMTPFLNVLEFFTHKDQQGNNVYRWHDMYKFIEDNYNDFRIMLIETGDETEGLLIKLNDIIKVHNEEYEKLSKKERRKLRKRNYDQEHFKTIDDLKAIQPTDTQKDGRVLTVRGSGKYQGLAKAGDKDSELDVELYANLLPTLTEVNIKGPETLQAIFEYLKEHNLLIGIVYQNDIIDAMNETYRVYSMNDNWLDRILSNMLHTSKLFMRLSPGFLLRNFIDTWNQLGSNITDKFGPGLAITNPKKITDIAIKTFKLKNLYENLQDARLTMQMQIHGSFIDLQRNKDNVVQNKLDDPTYTPTTDALNSAIDTMKSIHYELSAYVQGVSLIENKSGRISTRFEQSKQLLEQSEKVMLQIEAGTFKIEDIDLSETERSVKFLMGVRFAEFYELTNALADKASALEKSNKDKELKIFTNSDAFKYIRDAQKKLKTKQERDDLRQLVTDLSYFMETNAQLDYFQEENREYLQEYLRRRKLEDSTDVVDKPYTVLVQELQSIKKDEELAKMRFPSFWGIKKFISTVTGFRAYSFLNDWIETSGRIAGFLYDRYLLNQNINETVSNSLNRFFNYGNRSPIEMNMIIDIPYFSFPARTVNNWMSRLQNPRYLRLMSDIMDGVYEQYRDEDGMMSSYMNFQIENGWMPITKNIGLRLGNGAFDVYNILNSTGMQLQQRGSAPVRFLREAMQGSDFGDMLRQFASVNIVKQAVDASSILTGRDAYGNVPVVKDIVRTDQRATIANSINAFYDPGLDDYQKYTPKRYQYPKNGRLKYYENIYKDWFNKYGRMRKPKVDPISLVNEINWRNYVRWRRFKQNNR